MDYYAGIWSELTNVDSFKKGHVLNHGMESTTVSQDLLDYDDVFSRQLHSVATNVALRIWC